MEIAWQKDGQRFSSKQRSSWYLTACLACSFWSVTTHVLSALSLHVSSILAITDPV